MLLVPFLVLAFQASPSQTLHFTKRLPFGGGTVPEFLKYRAERSERGGYVAQIDVITGVGPTPLLDKEGKFGGISNPLWELYNDAVTSGSQTPSPGTVPLPNKGIDVFVPKILGYHDYLGTIMIIPLGEQLTTSYSRLPGMKTLNLTGKFRLRDLEKFGFTKKITFPFFVESHEYFVSVGSVNEVALLRAVALSGGLKFTELDDEYRFEVDATKLRENLVRSRAFYGIDDAVDYFSARMALKFKVLNRMSIADMERACKEKEKYTEDIDQRHPLYKDVLTVMDQSSKRLAPELRDRFKNRLSVRIAVYSLLNVSVEVETSPGRYYTL
ncbi:MAG: hypothetical protein WCK51_03620 [Armatimonadota bacterium]